MMRWSLCLPIFFITIVVHAQGFKTEDVKFRDVDFRVITLDLKQIDLKLNWKKPDGTPYETLNAVRERLGSQFVMATNSGIYAKDFSPLGLHIERGKVLQRLNRSRSSKGNFFLQPNGVFMLSANGAKILETAEVAKLGVTGVLEATQSGPLLLRKSVINPNFKENSQNVKLRSGVGITADGHVTFAISESLVSFYDFALFFREKLNCTDALYLDGTISTMWTANDTEHDSQVMAFVGIWTATKK